MSPVTGDLSLLMTRFLYLAIEKRCSWDSILRIDRYHDIKNELTFWYDNLKIVNKKRLSTYSIPKTAVYSDASNFAAGAFIVDVNDNVFLHMWNEIERTMSSTWRELKAIALALNSYRNYRIKRYSGTLIVKTVN